MLRLAVLLALASPALAQKGEPAFAPKDGRYTARFGGTPREQSQGVATAVGELTTRTATFARPDGTALVVVYTDYPDAALKNVAPESLLAGARDGLKGADGTLLSDEATPFGPGKLPSRTVVVDRGKLVVRVRLVAAGRRLYQVMAVGTKDAVAGPAADAFFESFALTK